MIKDRVLCCLENIGCSFEAEGINDLSQIIDTSIMFITFIVELEQEFEIEIPDEFLVISAWRTMDDICSLLENILGFGK